MSSSSRYDLVTLLCLLSMNICKEYSCFRLESLTFSLITENLFVRSTLRRGSAGGCNTFINKIQKDFFQVTLNLLINKILILNMKISKIWQYDKTWTVVKSDESYCFYWISTIHFSTIFRWDKVSKLEKGRIYSGGTIDQFQSLTGFTGRWDKENQFRSRSDKLFSAHQELVPQVCDVFWWPSLRWLGWRDPPSRLAHWGSHQRTRGGM